MENTLTNLYNKLNNNPQDALRKFEIQIDGIVSNISVRKDKIIKITLLTKNLPDCNLLIEAEAEFERLMFSNEVIICPFVSEKPEDNEVLNYIPWALSHLEKKNFLLSVIFRGGKYAYAPDKGVIISLTSELSGQRIETGCDILKELLAELFNKNISVKTKMIDPGESCLSDYAHYFSKELENAKKSVKQAKGEPKKNTENSFSEATPERLGKSKAASKSIKKDSKKKNSEKIPYKPKKQPKGVIWGRMDPGIKLVKMNLLTNETGLATLQGHIFEFESKTISNGTRSLVKFCITDKTNSVRCIAFMKNEEAFDFEVYYKDSYLKILADVGFDPQYEKDLVAKVIGIQKENPPKPNSDNSESKRVELHAHTKMSSKDAMCTVSELIDKAVEYGHKAVAVTDHGVVQAFPDARECLKKHRKKGRDIKVIYGMECYLSDDGPVAAYCFNDCFKNDRFVSIHIGTTGDSPDRSRIIDLAGVIFKKTDNNEYAIDDVFRKNIRNENIKDGISYNSESFTALMEFKEFIGENPVVADGVLDILSFLRYEGNRTKEEAGPKIKFYQNAVDTRRIKEIFYNGEEKFVEQSKSFLKFQDDRNQKADCFLQKCILTGGFFSAFIRAEKISSIPQINEKAGQLDTQELFRDTKRQHHCVLLAKDSVGLYGLYRMVSYSHLKYIYRGRPRVTGSMLEYFKTGCLAGSACEAGELFKSVTGHYDSCKKNYDESLKTLEGSKASKVASFYDYLEIMPVENNAFMLRTSKKKDEIIDSEYESKQDLININKLIFRLGEILDIPVCATCDVHFLNSEDFVYREIMQKDMEYEDAGMQPPLFFRTTDEMLEEFDYLGKDNARKAVVINPGIISDMIRDDMKPFPEGTFPPEIPTAADDVKNITWNTAKSMYGKDDKMPKIVKERIKKELDAIIGNGFAVMYYIAYKLVKQSNEDGYIVGSRGSVGSSLVATLCGITEVNPLPPHYYCPQCCFCEFFIADEFRSGYDLPEKKCPECKSSLTGEGQDIPFETFLGFDGEKQPDIDLNFSGEYQSRAHKIAEDMFGKSHTFRAGTISGYAQKNAFAMVSKYCSQSEKPFTKAEIIRLSKGIIGVRRNTSQHPGGIVVVPKNRDIYEFTPVQCPADKIQNNIITTHFDFNSLHDTILKLDILGHDDPTMLKMLGDLTGENILDIPVNDDSVMKLFTSEEPLKKKWETTSACATLGLPELGTFMARGMIEDTKPKRFYDLVQLMGLSHGTDVWKGNARDLIKEGICDITEVIGCRDSIMTTLMRYGLKPKESFVIMEKVRKGKGLTQKQEELLKSFNVPDWYIDSCKKIKYMFPKAHAVAYSISALRIAWFKVYRKEEYYCAFFTVRADEFDGRLMCRGFEKIKHYLEIFRAGMNSKEKTVLKIHGKQEEFSPERCKSLFYILELTEEMYAREVEFLPVDIYRSEATDFIKEKSGFIRPPLNTLPSISTAVAKNIVKSKNKHKEFISCEDMASKCKIGDAVLKVLKDQGCLDELPETTQMDIFSYLS